MIHKRKDMEKYCQLVRQFKNKTSILISGVLPRIVIGNAFLNKVFSHDEQQMFTGGSYVCKPAAAFLHAA